jgi:hypothetical protein
MRQRNAKVCELEPETGDSSSLMAQPPIVADNVEDTTQGKPPG